MSSQGMEFTVVPTQNLTPLAYIVEYITDENFKNKIDILNVSYASSIPFKKEKISYDDEDITTSDISVVDL